MPRSAASRARRTLVWLAVLTVAMVGGLGAAVQFSNGAWTPRLALDLAGGTQIVLTPVVAPGEGQITEQTIADAITIIRQRVDSSGVSEAEVTSQGGQNIVVSLPGDPAEQAEARALVSQAAQMRFRPVLVAAPAQPVDPGAVGATPEGDAAAPTEGAPTEGAPTEGAPEVPAEGAPGETPAVTPSSDGSVLPPVLTAGGVGATPAPEAAATPAPGPAATPAPEGAPADPGTPSTEPVDASDLAQITPEDIAAFETLDCSDPVAVGSALADVPASSTLVTCDADGTVKYVLGPVEVEGTDIDDAVAGFGTTSTGAATNEWVVQIDLDDAGADAFFESTARISALEPPRNQFAIVLDGQVLSAPSVAAPIAGGDAEISGAFNQETATTLANQLKFGALPISFTEQTSEQISAILGGEQLQRGLLAGAIGLVLVAGYSLLQYRALGLVTIGSLVVAAILNYAAICLLGWSQGYRLSLAGVAGFIIGIGITADSFIVFFERVRDEVREGRQLVAAVETGWRRARRTILISGAINFLAAAVLYVLAVGSVRGFAFTLGLTSLIDLLVVVLFSHPVVVLLARARFFGSGHKLSGLDAEHLGRTVAYAGRGRVRSSAAPRLQTAGSSGAQPGKTRGRRGQVADEPRLTIAERKAAAAAGLADPPPPSASPRGGSTRAEGERPAGGGTTTATRSADAGTDDAEELRP